MIYLSKSKYCGLWQCPKIAWMKKYKPEELSLDGSVISRMEAEPQRRFGRRRKADYDDYENAVEEETPTAPTGRTASDDQEGVFEDLDEEEMDELRHPAFGMKQVVRAAIALIIAAAVFFFRVS